MTDVFAFCHQGGTSSAGSRCEDGCCIFAAADSGDDCSAGQWTAACVMNEESTSETLLKELLEQTGEETGVAALAIVGEQAAWLCRSGTKVCRVRSCEVLPDGDSGTAEVLPNDAFLLCSDSARRMLLAEEIIVDLLKAKNARQWAELLLLRITERLANPPEGLSLLTVRIFSDE